MTESSNAKSFKAKINNYAKSHKIPAQVVLQNYMFERFLQRLSQSEFRDNFIVKGGMLIANLVGLDTRSTMDLDTTLKNMHLTENEISKSLQKIFSIDTGDNVKFKLLSILPIRKDDVYGGFRIRFDTIFETIETPLSIDVSTGDIITPAPVEYQFKGMFNDSNVFKLFGYNMETVLAEKTESILARGILTTRPRDFYDVFILCKTQNYDKTIFKQALKETSKHRGTFEKISSPQTILHELENNENLKIQWKKYQQKFSYARDIDYSETINALKELIFEY